MIIAVDTGGTKTLITAFSEDGSVSDMLRFPTPLDQQEYVTLLRKTLQQQYAHKDVHALVIALPGIIKNGVAVWCNNLKWENFDAHKAFRGVLGDAPVLIENDANLAGLSESHFLSATPSLLYVTLSTGIGTGFITNQKINEAMRHSEGGRMLVEFNNERREWETFASGNAIRLLFGKFAKEITKEADWKIVANRVCHGFLAVIPLTQPEVIVIGGSLGTYFNRYEKYLKGYLVQSLPAHIPCPQIVQAKNPEEAVIYGCYYYALDQLAN